MDIFHQLTTVRPLCSHRYDLEDNFLKNVLDDGMMMTFDGGISGSELPCLAFSRPKKQIWPFLKNSLASKLFLIYEVAGLIF